MSAFDAIERADAHGRIAEYWRERADAAEAERDEWKTAAEYEQAKKLEYQREANAAEAEVARLRALLEEAAGALHELIDRMGCPMFTDVDAHPGFCVNCGAHAPDESASCWLQPKRETSARLRVELGES